MPAYDPMNAPGAAANIRQGSLAFRVAELLMDSMSFGLVEVDTEETILTSNECADRLFGVAFGALSGRNLKEFLRPETLEFVRRQTARRTPGVANRYCVEIQQPGGTCRWLDVTVSPTFNARGRLATMIGILVDANTAESSIAIRGLDRNFQAILDHSNQAILVVDLEGCILLANTVYANLVGTSVQDLLGTRIAETLTGMLEHKRWDRVERALQLGRPVSGEDVIQGHIWWNRVCPVANEAGVIDRLVIFGEEISERRETEKALSAGRELFLNGPVVTMRRRSEARWPVVNVSPNVETILGYSPSELLSGRISFADLIHPDDLPLVSRELEDQLTKGAPFFEQRYRLRTAEGKVRWFHDVTRIVAEPTGRGSFLHGYMVDITDHHETQEAFWQAQKAVGLGALASGIAHDLNNLVQAFICHLELLENTSLDKRQRNSVLSLHSAANLASGMVMKLLAYARQQIPAQIPSDLNALILEFTQLMEAGLGRKVRLQLELGAGALEASMDPGLIHQVLMNLVVNAKDAMPGGGIITIRTGLEQREEGPMIWFEIEDEGPGISPDVQIRMYETFFTTKAPGKGTGLGLSVVSGIITAHHGVLECRSAPGEGTCFKALFPWEPSSAIESPDPPRFV